MFGKYFNMCNNILFGEILRQCSSSWYVETVSPVEPEASPKPETKLADLPSVEGVKEYFYYLRDKDRRPLITVCLGYNHATKEAYRGTAYCSAYDSPVKVKGKVEAKKRMLRAYNKRSSSLPVERSEINDIAHECYNHLNDDDKKYYFMTSASDGVTEWVFSTKSEFNPTLTGYEIRLVTITAPDYTPNFN